MNCKVVEGCRAINQPQTYFTEQSIFRKYHPNLPIDINKMKLSSASAFLILTSSISTSTADDDTSGPRHRRTSKGGKGKAGKKHQQCEMIEVIVNSSPPFDQTSPTTTHATPPRTISGLGIILRLYTEIGPAKTVTR